MNGKKYDVAIIGGGAAGMCCAAALKMRDKTLKIVVLEQLSRVGKKLITTGNGRCNITNKFIDMSRYHSENMQFAEYALNTFDNSYIESFFEKLGIVFKYDEVGRAYPYSLQASSVVDAVRFYLDESGVETLVDSKVLSLRMQQGMYDISLNDNRTVCSKTVLVASGLYSGGEKLGSNASMLKVLKALGYKTVKTTPAIVQIRTENSLSKSLKGIKVNAEAHLVIDNKRVRSDFGEVLFCDYGLSGPPIMQISREVERSEGNKKILLDLMNEYSFNEIADMLNSRAAALKERNLEEFFTGLLNKRVGQAVVKLSGKKLSDKVSDLKISDFKTMANIIKNMEFKVTGTTGFENSQVTAGGIDTTQFDRYTMMSKKDRGLFAAGEVLDIDGDCGGFNLQWAWSSAICAADGIIKYLGGM